MSGVGTRTRGAGELGGGEGVVADLAPVDAARPAPDLERLRALVDKRTAPQASGRAQLAQDINAALRDLERQEPSREVADFLLMQLESGALAGLVDPKGRGCRATAVEALISMGFPYALEVSPDDLEHLRAEKGATALRPPVAAGLGLVFLAGAISLASTLEEGAGALKDLSASQTALMVVAALGAALARPGTDGRKWSQALLVFAGLLGLALGLFGPGSMALAGAASLMAWWLSTRQPER